MYELAQVTKNPADILDPKLQEALQAQLKEVYGVEELQQKSPVVFAFMRDCSGSMGMWENHLVELSYKWILAVAREIFPQVKAHYVIHHTDAREVPGALFMEAKQQGGTICSTAFRKAHELLSLEEYNGYRKFVFHLSDGDNLTSDNDHCIKVVKSLLHDLRIHYIGYLEFNQYNRSSTLLRGYKNLEERRFGYVQVRDWRELLHNIMPMMNQIISTAGTNSSFSDLLRKL